MMIYSPEAVFARSIAGKETISLSAAQSANLKAGAISSCKAVYPRASIMLINVLFTIVSLLLITRLTYNADVSISTADLPMKYHFQYI